MKPTIISLSGKARHGKDSTVKIIQDKLESQNKKCLHMAYGNLVKYICKEYFNWNGQKDEKGRTILQQIGTNKIRSKEPNFWVDFIINLLNVIGEDYDYILISDCRFLNEIQRYMEEGYYIITIYVERLNFDNGLTEEQKNHPSETALNDYEFDYYLEAKNLNELECEISSKLGFLF